MIEKKLICSLPGQDFPRHPHFRKKEYFAFLSDDETMKNSKKQRSSWSDTLQYLSKKEENDRDLKKQELELQRQEMAMRHGQFQDTQQQSQQMMTIMLQLLQNKQ